MSRHIAEKLEELNNPQPLEPPVRKIRRATTVVPFKSTTPKRKKSMHVTERKHPLVKKATLIPSIAE